MDPAIKSLKIFGYLNLSYEVHRQNAHPQGYIRCIAAPLRQCLKNPNGLAIYVPCASLRTAWQKKEELVKGRKYKISNSV